MRMRTFFSRSAQKSFILTMGNSIQGAAPFLIVPTERPVREGRIMPNPTNRRPTIDQVQRQQSEALTREVEELTFKVAELKLRVAALENDKENARNYLLIGGLALMVILLALKR